MTQQTLWEWRDCASETALKDGGETCTRGSLDVSELAERSVRQMNAARQLHASLEAKLGVVDLVITDNRRRMFSSRSRGNRREIRVHHMFLECGRRIVRAIARLATGDERARARIKAYIRRNRDAIRFELGTDELCWEGDYFDLKALLESVASHVDDEVEDEALRDISITWGRDGRGVKSIRFGSFDFDQRLIRIHPALDQSWVPEYFVEFIIYHELLHALYPPTESGGERRCVHTEEFREMERRFPHYEKALSWEAANLRRILDREPG